MSRCRTLAAGQVEKVDAADLLTPKAGAEQKPSGNPRVTQAKPRQNPDGFCAETNRKPFGFLLPSRCRPCADRVRIACGSRADRVRIACGSRAGRTVSHGTAPGQTGAGSGTGLRGEVRKVHHAQKGDGRQPSPKKGRTPQAGGLRPERRQTPSLAASPLATDFAVGQLDPPQSSSPGAAPPKSPCGACRRGGGHAAPRGRHHGEDHSANTALTFPLICGIGCQAPKQDFRLSLRGLHSVNLQSEPSPSNDGNARHPGIWPTSNTTIRWQT